MVLKGTGIMGFWESRDARVTAVPRNGHDSASPVSGLRPAISNFVIMRLAGFGGLETWTGAEE